MPSPQKLMALGSSLNLLGLAVAGHRGLGRITRQYFAQFCGPQAPKFPDIASAVRGHIVKSYFSGTKMRLRIKSLPL